MMLNHTKVRKSLNRVLQLFIIILTYGFIYRQIFYKDGITGLVSLIEKNFSQTVFFRGLVFVAVLMVVNWGIETYKWQMLIRKVEHIKFLRAFQAILAGISISSFIPNRVGEFFGRAFYLKEANPSEGILISIIGSISQLIITVLAGSVSLLFFVHANYGDIFFFNGYLYYTFVILILSLDFIILGLFLNVSFLSTLKEKILRNGLKNIRKYFRIFEFYHNRELLFALSCSLFRYFVFSSQFYLLLRIFGVMVPYLDGLMLISLIYFIMTVIPTVALTELGIRGSVAIYIFAAYFSGSPFVAEDIATGVFAASTLLWFINLGIPATLGGIFVFQLQFFRKRQL